MYFSILKLSLVNYYNRSSLKDLTAYTCVFERKENQDLAFQL